jgi:rubredoxin-NAD+ reductase
MNPIIILGSGLAGYNVAKELRKLDKETPLTVITADSGSFYSKPMLSNALAGKKPPSAIALNSPEQMATQLNATVRAKTRVTSLNAAAHTIHIGDETLAYSKLVLALGADQIRLPITGDAADAIITVNDLDDYGRFHTLLDGQKRVVIIGAGLIGSEFANDLAVGGHHAEVIDIAALPLGRLLPPQGGEMVRDRLQVLGVVWHFGTGTKSVERNGRELKVTLDNGTVIAADIVLSAVGLKPRTDLARAAGLTVNRGVVVNRNLQTSDADIYALGDCMEIENLVMPYVMPIMHAARALGSTLSATLGGKPTPVSFPAMPVMVKTPACPTIVSPPAAGAAGEWQVEQTADGVKSLFVDASGKLLGFALNGSATAERAKLAPQLPAVLA